MGKSEKMELCQKKITCQSGKIKVLYSMDMKDIVLVSCKKYLKSMHFTG